MRAALICALLIFLVSFLTQFHAFSGVHVDSEDAIGVSNLHLLKELSIRGIEKNDCRCVFPF